MALNKKTKGMMEEWKNAGNQGEVFNKIKSSKGVPMAQHSSFPPKECLRHIIPPKACLRQTNYCHI